MVTRAPEVVRSPIADIAVLEIEGIMDVDPGDRRFPREAAIAFPDGRPGLAWLVSPESAWCSAVPEKNVTFGSGLPPSVVAREMADAVEGFSVYADVHLAAGTWLAVLFAAGGNKGLFQVRDLNQLFVGPGHRVTDLGEETRSAALAAASRRVPQTERAAAEAARRLAFVSALSVAVR